MRVGDIVRVHMLDDAPKGFIPQKHLDPRCENARGKVLAIQEGVVFVDHGSKSVGAYRSNELEILARQE